MNSPNSTLLAKNKLIDILLHTYLLGEQSEELNVVEVIELIKQQLLELSLSKIKE